MNSYRVYVAGAWDDYLIIRDVQLAVVLAGFDLSHDWTEAHDEYPDGVAPEYVGLFASLEDLWGVYTADVLLLVTTDRPTRGGWVELGYALSHGKKVMVVGPQRDKCVFTSLCERYASVSEALKALKEAA